MFGSAASGFRRAHLLERGSAASSPAPWLRRGGDVEPGEPLRRLTGGHAGERLGALVEGQQSHDREARDAANGLHRVDELLEVVERLDHEEVGAPAFEDRGLLGEELAPQAPAGRPRRWGRSTRR